MFTFIKKTSLPEQLIMVCVFILFGFGVHHFGNFILNKKENISSFSCVGEVNIHDTTKNDLLRYLKEGVDLFPCNVNINGESFKIPYGRLLKYDTLGIDKINDYLIREVGPLDEMELFDRLHSQVQTQYLMVKLAYQFGFGGVGGCTFEELNTGTCYAYFSGDNGIGKYKFNSFNEEFSTGGSSIECLLNRQVKNHLYETKEELLNDGVKECNVIYVEHGGQYDVGFEFATQKEKDNTLKYITKKINNEIEYTKNMSKYEIIEGKIISIKFENKEIDKIEEGEMSENYIITIEFKHGNYVFEIDGSYGTFKKGDFVSVNFTGDYLDQKLKVYSINKLE